MMKDIKRGQKFLDESIAESRQKFLDEFNAEAHLKSISLQEKLKEWDEPDFKDLCQKLQNALAKSYVDCEDLEKANFELVRTVTQMQGIIKYLELKLENPPV